MKAFFTMLKVELKLSLRDMNMPIFAIALPVVIALVLALVYGGAPAFEGAGYTHLQQSFGATASVGIVASGVMGLPLALSDYRDKKILKRYRCTPVTPALLLSVQVVKYALYALACLLAVYAVYACFGYTMPGNALAFLGAFLLAMLALFGIGLLVAALAPSAQAAGLICALLYFPMLIFSGATLPYELMPGWLQTASDFLPLTQGIKLLQGTSLGLSGSGLTVPICVLSLLAAVCAALSALLFRWNRSR